MERHTKFLDWKNQYFENENDYTTQSNLQIHFCMLFNLTLMRFPTRYLSLKKKKEFCFQPDLSCLKKPKKKKGRKNK